MSIRRISCHYLQCLENPIQLSCSSGPTADSRARAGTVKLANLLTGNPAGAAVGLETNWKWSSGEEQVSSKSNKFNPGRKWPQWYQIWIDFQLFYSCILLHPAPTVNVWDGGMYCVGLESDLSVEYEATTRRWFQIACIKTGNRAIS